jgi:hypothetical protein
MVNQTSPDFFDDWSWLSDEPADIQLDIGSFDVIAVVFEVGQRGDTQACLEAVAASSIQPVRVVRPEELPDNAEWLWILPNTCEPKPDALQALLSRAAKNPAADVVAGIQTEPRRRGPATLINSYGQTVSGFGRLRTLADPGEFYQGQLQVARVLGAPAAGMLVKGDLWRHLGGFEQILTPTLWGLEFGWRANLSGAQVVVEPDAEIVVNAIPDGAAERAGVLAMASAHSRRGLRWLVDLKLILVTLLAALGFTIGKDLASAGEEMAGLGRWLFGRKRRKQVRKRAKEVLSRPEWIADTRALRPDRTAGLKHAVDSVAARIADWLATFTGQDDSTGLDELIADDYTSSEPKRRIPTVLIGLGVTLGAAIGAGRGLIGEGSLRAAEMLPVADSGETLVSHYLTAIPGDAGLSTPPWEALAGLASFITLGQPEWLVSLLVVGCVPLTWLAAYRFARGLATSNGLVSLAAAAYALAPILSGGFNSSGFAASVWSLLLPVAGYSVLWWHRDGLDTWRGAGAVGFWLLLLTALYPPIWALAALALIIEAIIRRQLLGAAQRLLVIIIPGLLLVGPWRETLLQYPGRLLTGIDPSFAPGTAFEWWQAPLAAVNGEYGPPLWISASCLGVLWLAAVAGVLRRPKVAVLLVVAAVMPVLATAANRLLVYVPPGSWTRPDGTELVIVMIGCLAIAVSIGMDGVGEQLRTESAGIKHLAILGVSVLGVAAVILGSVWWVISGEVKVLRGPVGDLPAFVVIQAQSETPGRILAIKVRDGGSVGWMLIDDDYPRLGDAERGLVYSGDQVALTQLRSVVSRLVVGAADDQLVGDLVDLGVSAIWVSGGDEALRMGISNTPGLAGGTGDEEMTWPIPDSGLVTVLGDEERIATGDGLEIPAGASGRRLHLAEPADSRWQVSVSGQQLAAAASSGPGNDFTLGAGGGRLGYRLQVEYPWWAWVQLGGLVLVIALALPGVQVRNVNAGGRRLRSGRDQPELVDPGPRRAR